MKTGPESERGRVRERDRLVFRLEAADSKHRPEDL
jgi:hypothetical protein